MTLSLKLAPSANDREGKCVWEGEWRGGQERGGNSIYHCGLISQRRNVWAVVLNWNQHQMQKTNKHFSTHW